jgi:transcriptional regulator with XRE-family HTH domain
VDEPLPYDHSSELQNLIGRLKRERIRKGLSLGDVARMTDQARSALSRLESGEYSNPTFHTVYRYARALGWHVKLSARRFSRQADADAAP